MPSSFTIYAIALLLFGIAAGVSSWWFFKLDNNNLSQWERLPRMLIPGVIFAFADLIWCIPHAKPLLPTAMGNFLIPGAFFFTWLCFQFLDYLFSRAIGGFLILLAHYFLHESFTFHTPVAPLFALGCFVIGIIGICFAGKPYWLRDLIRKCAATPKWRYTCSGFFLSFGVLSLILGIIHLVNGPQ